MKDKYQYERSDLGHIRASLRHLFVIVGMFSFLVNLLLLTGPLYMLEPVRNYFTQALREY
jgi:ABC-type protease/lipase transport system fused ATPase/permease subunit